MTTDLTATKNLYVAFNKELNITKVGISSDPVRRVKSFKNFELLYVWDCEKSTIARDVESTAIYMLKPWTVKGNEWFILPKNISIKKTIDRIIIKCKHRDNEKKETFIKNYFHQFERIKKDNRLKKPTPKYILSREVFYRDRLMIEWGVNITTYQISL